MRTESPRVRLCIDGCPSQLLPDSPSIVTLSECILLLRALECVFSTHVMDGALFCTPPPLPPNPSFSPSAFDSFIASFYSAPIKVSDSSSAVVQIWGPLLFFIRSVSHITIQPLRTQIQTLAQRQKQVEIHHQWISQMRCWAYPLNLI